MTKQASGTFTTKATPQPPYDTADGVSLGRLSIAKVFSGDLEGTGAVEMLSAGTSTPGSAGYVAIERVTGTLQGKAGSFVLQHSGTMNRGVPSLTITVVPDSGTAGLLGLSGTMKISNLEGQHSYSFVYELETSA